MITNKTHKTIQNAASAFLHYNMYSLHHYIENTNTQWDFHSSIIIFISRYKKVHLQRVHTLRRDILIATKHDRMLLFWLRAKGGGGGISDGTDMGLLECWSSPTVACGGRRWKDCKFVHLPLSWRLILYFHTLNSREVSFQILPQKAHPIDADKISAALPCYMSENEIQKETDIFKWKLQQRSRALWGKRDSQRRNKHLQ